MIKKYAFLLSFLLIGCTNSNDSEGSFDMNSFPQEWKLTGMSGGLTNNILIGNDMPWQENITLEEDGRFLKARQFEEVRIEGAGSFSFEEKEGETYLNLEYDSETLLIESCTGEKLNETLFMRNTESLTGGSAPCDGPGLFYDRIK
ncbi:MAG: hypothetical protein WBN11_14040 [Eudoraea sp.]|uniref:hypothetical protein n=1 Tax=Eudoraea sp. TaxID=1979955 RepID=UPI003C727F9E